ncbi:2-hydroxyacid dehydrogenase [Chthonobacter rhizosphaerae]|uniref:2-hydroxyacid dehydrogenase n=1 Tax=Chthonobacter rhizosphaerae TaxID=2735553 RepID=UPI0015EFA405|nr:2-hydroxyacid dehydrogenase [Chthonobacter rhizosphaerae]
MAVPLLLTGPSMAFVRDQLDARFEIHDLHAAEDKDALLDAVGPTIRAVATAGSAGVGADLMRRLPNLEIVAHFGVGYDPVDVGHAASAGVVVTNTPDVLTDEVADTAMGLLLMTVRELSAAERWVRAGNWETKGAYRLTRGSLTGRRLGIFGLGRIGKAIARRAEAFGLSIAYHNRRPVADVAYPYHDTLVGLAAAVDTLMVVAPGGPGTRHAVNAAVLEALGPDGVLVNVGRGSVVDEAALVAALERGALLGAGLDVFEAEPRVHPGLMTRDDVVLLPHVGSASIPTRQAMGQVQVDNLAAWFDGKPPLTPVPETPVPAGRG